MVINKLVDKTVDGVVSHDYLADKTDKIVDTPQRYS
jgi:hypothetical protein